MKEGLTPGMHELLLAICADARVDTRSAVNAGRIKALRSRGLIELAAAQLGKRPRFIITAKGRKAIA